jgi:hypothetical protein
LETIGQFRSQHPPPEFRSPRRRNRAAPAASIRFFSNFGDQSWAAYGFDIGIRIFETGAVVAVPEPETFALTGLGLLALIGERRRWLRPAGTRA